MLGEKKKLLIFSLTLTFYAILFIINTVFPVSILPAQVKRLGTTFPRILGSRFWVGFNWQSLSSYLAPQKWKTWFPVKADAGHQMSFKRRLARRFQVSSCRTTCSAEAGAWAQNKYLPLSPVSTGFLKVLALSWPVCLKRPLASINPLIHWFKSSS